MKKLVLIAALAAGMTTVTNAASISGSTDFKVTVPEILVLYHWDEAHLTLTTSNTTVANDSDDHEISDATTRTQSVDLTSAQPFTVTGPVDTTSSMATSPLGTVKVTLQNSWAVRSISSDDVNLAVAIQSKDLLHGGTDTSSTAVVSNAKVKSGTITTATNIDIPSQWDATLGDIDFDLDLSGVTKAGEHKTAATAAESTDTFLLTLTGN